VKPSKPSNVNKSMSKIISMPPDLVAKCVEALPEWLRHHVESGYKRNLSIAGGFVRDTIGGYPVKDIDVFFWSDGQLNDAKEVASIHGGELTVTPQSYTYASKSGEHPPVSLIKDIGCPIFNDRIQDFDFECCMGEITFYRGAWEGCMSEQFLDDVKAKRLTFTGQVSFPDDNGIGAMIRAVKFVGRGWSIDTPNLLAIGMNIREKSTRTSTTIHQS